MRLRSSPCAPVTLPTLPSCSDFEWYTPTLDYALPATGSPTWQDFSYNSITFPAPQKDLFTRYRSKYNIRFGGIRKPRLGNSDMLSLADTKGWLLGQFGQIWGKADGTRNTNFSVPEFAAWYAEQQAQYLADGVQFFW